MRRDIDWDDLRIFLALKRQGTFSAAARALGVNATTVSRRLVGLEEKLGTQLFQRTSEALRATREAELILDSVLRMERQASLVVNQIAGRDALLEGTVRVATTRQFAREVLLDRLAPLCARHPGIQVELVAGDLRADLTRDEADVAIRFQIVGRGPPAESDSHVEIRALKVATIAVGVYASKGYLARAGRPKDAYDMRGHELIVCSDEAPHMPGRAWRERVQTLGRVALRVDMGTMSSAVSAGFGIGALVSVYAARHDNLVRLQPPAAVDERESLAAHAERSVRVARVRAVWDYLAETMGALGKPRKAVRPTRGSWA